MGKRKKINYCDIGGQAVLEGVMMKSDRRMAMAVRRPDQGVALEYVEYPDKPKSIWRRIPILRGVLNFGTTMKLGFTTLTKSAELAGLEEELKQEQPGRFEQWLSRHTKRSAFDFAMVVAMMLAIALSIGLFFVLPSLAATGLKNLIIDPFLLNLAEGGVRMLIFLGYLVLVTSVKDVRRVFQYHGAEHQTIHCHERGWELTVDNVQRCTRLHPRCGTSFLLLVMIVSIILFSLLGKTDTWWWRILSRLLLLPVVAGVSYELLKLLARSEAWPVRALRWPGLMLQKLSTRAPEDSMCEIAIIAFRAVLDGREAVARQIYDPQSEKAEEAPEQPDILPEAVTP